MTTIRSRAYWRKREEANLKSELLKEKAYTKALSDIYSDMMDSIQKEIDAFYTKYAGEEGITYSEAVKRASKLDIEAYGRKARKYIKEHDLSPTANAEMRLYNLTMKANRLEVLKAEIGAELARCFNDIEGECRYALNERTQEELERQAGILGDTVHDNEKAANAIVNASFKNATFSDRIWMHQDILKGELNNLLSQGLIQGKHPSVLARDLRKRVDVSKHDAERLLRTELCRVQIEAQKQSYERNGYDEYEFIALEGHACSICSALDGQHCKVSGMVPAENAPPMHPNCRCSTAAWVDRAKSEEEVEANSHVGFDQEERRKGRVGSLEIRGGLFSSAKYRNKFDQLTEDPKIARQLYHAAKIMLTHRSGTDFEDMSFTDNSGRTLIQQHGNEHSQVSPTKAMKQMVVEGDAYSVIAMHNHSGNSLPSLSDLKNAKIRKYRLGVVLCHDGTIFAYHVSDNAAI